MVRLRDWLMGMGWTELWAVVGAMCIGLVAAFAVVEVLRALGPRIVSTVARPKRKWVAAITRYRVFRSVGWVVVILITDALISPLLETWPRTLAITKTAIDSTLVVAVTVMLSKSIAAATYALEIQEGRTQRLPLKSLGQALQLVLWTYATVVFLSVVSNRDVTTLLTGLTAIGAVLVYVFRDPILGWTAGVQIAANDLARIGDWITVPDHDADGVVIEIALTTIKVRNWDKTVSTIPTYALVSEGFRNWRGMYESRGRRMKRALAVDANTVRVCDEGLFERLRSEGLLQPGLESLKPPATNLACFRAWLEHWLMAHPEINHALTAMVRELAPDGRGIPVEIYAFARDTSWVAYEHLQADIYDHAIATLPAFDLRVFQEPTGDDIRSVTFGDAVNRTGP